LNNNDGEESTDEIHQIKITCDDGSVKTYELLKKQQLQRKKTTDKIS
jgi:hypothetical protein